MNFNFINFNIKDVLINAIILINVIIVLIVFFTYLKSFLNKRRSKEVKKLQKIWYKSFRDLSIIKVKKNRIEDFLLYWNTLFNRDELGKRVRLIEIARMMDLEHRCFKFVQKKYLDNHYNNKVCLNIHTIGNISMYKAKADDDNSITKLLDRISRKGNDDIAFESVIALLKADDKKYARIAINQLIKRIGWNNEHHKQFKVLNNNSSALSIFKKYLSDPKNKSNEDRIVEIIAATNNLPHFATFILRNRELFSDNSICHAMKNLNGRVYFKYVEPIMDEENIWYVDVNIINLIKKFRIFNTKNLNYLVDKINSDNWWVVNNSSEALAEYIKFDRLRYKNILGAIKTDIGKKSLKYNVEQYVINRQNEMVGVGMENSNG